MASHAFFSKEWLYFERKESFSFAMFGWKKSKRTEKKHHPENDAKGCKMKNWKRRNYLVDCDMSTWVQVRNYDSLSAVCQYVFIIWYKNHAGTKLDRIAYHQGHAVRKDTWLLSVPIGFLSENSKWHASRVCIITDYQIPRLCDGSMFSISSEAKWLDFGQQSSETKGWVKPGVGGFTHPYHLAFGLNQWREKQNGVIERNKVNMRPSMIEIPFIKHTCSGFHSEKGCF